MTDVSGLFLAVDENFCSTLGRSAAELKATRLLDITHCDDRTYNAADLDHLKRTGEPFRIRKRYIKPSGRIIWVENHVSLFRDGCGPTRLTASTRVLSSNEVQRSRGRPQLRTDDLAPYLRTALRDALVHALEKAAARGEFPPSPAAETTIGDDTVVRIANKLMEAHDVTALDCDPMTRKLIEVALLHVGLRLADDADPMQFVAISH